MLNLLHHVGKYVKAIENVHDCFEMSKFIKCELAIKTILQINSK